jgi:DNA-binding MarR family transcriptional regulator
MQKWSQSVIHKIFKLQILLDKIGAKLVSQSTILKNNDFAILMTLVEYPEFNQQQIALFLNIPKSKMSMDIENMVNKKLVNRLSDPLNRRQNKIIPSEFGMKQLETAYLKLFPEIEKATKTIGDDKINKLNNILDEFISATEKLG